MEAEKGPPSTGVVSPKVGQLFKRGRKCRVIQRADPGSHHHTSEDSVLGQDHRETEDRALPNRRWSEQLF